MKNHLFPNRFKALSGWIFYLALIAGSYLWFTDQFDDLLVVPVPDFFSTGDFLSSEGFWIENGILDELLTIVIIVSGIVHSFSREKIEDELIAKLRLDSLIWSLYVNYAIMILATLLIFGLAYFHVLVFNLFTIILFFNLRLRFALRKHYTS